MGAEAFSVDVGALKDAGLGASDLMALLDRHRVGDIDCDVDAVGHEELGAALASFCERWQVGIQNLTQNGRGLSRRLIDSAGAYLEVDHHIAASMARIAQQPDAGEQHG